MRAYIADRENATSAYGELSNGEAIRVTFCAAPPPLVSYVCIWCPNLPPTALLMQPAVEAAEADLVLFRLALARDPCKNQYFVYKAPARGKGPSLWRLDRPQNYLPYRHNIALLARREVSEGGHIRPHVDDDGHYYMATLNHDQDKPQNFNMLLYNSMYKKWSSTPVPLDMTQIHIPGKAIALGQGGLLGFVDLWRGILVCDVLGRKRPHFLPLPAQLVRFDKLLDGQPWLSRNIAFVNGRLTVVEQHRNPDYPLKSLNQELTTWSISSPWEAQDGWQMDYRINTSGIMVDDATANVDLLLCKLQENGKLRQENVTPQLPTCLDRLPVLRPALSLSESHIVYLMAKVSRRDNKPLVLSVDMRYPRLQGVAVFDAERMTGY